MIGIKALSLFQENPQSSDLKHDFWNTFKSLFPPLGPVELLGDICGVFKLWNELSSAPTQILILGKLSVLPLL